MRQAKAHCEFLRKNGLEKDTEKCLRDAEKMEEETGKNIQMSIATAKGTESQLAAGTSNYLEDVHKTLERLRMQQANMTPAERRDQARWDPSLLFSDNPQYRPLVMVNPAIIDRTLPRTSVQLIQVRFDSDLFDRTEESKFKHADGWGLLNLQKTAHWEDLREILAK